MARKKVTNEQLNQIKQLYLQGNSIKQISEETGLAYMTVSSHIKSMGIFQYKTRRWTSEEMQYLKDNYATADWNELLSTLNRFSKEAIISKASVLKIKREIFFWSDEDLAILKQGYDDKLSCKEIRSLLNNKFTEDAIVTKANLLGYRKREWWSDEDNALLIEVYPNKTINEICLLFPNRTREQIIAHAQVFNLKNKIYWTDEEKSFVINNYKNMNDDELAEALGRPRKGVSDMRRKLGCYVFQPGVYNYLGEWIRKRNKEWKKESARNCGFKCVITGERFNAVHHLFGMNMILAQTLKELSYDEEISIHDLSESDLENILSHFLIVQKRYPLGVCLTTKIHKEFHDEYGYGFNTPEQFNEFLEKHNYKIA